MKSKAASSLAEAVVLARASRWSGAANRTYYALYQALVGELEGKGHRPEEFGPRDPHRPGWRHATLLNNARLAGLDYSDAVVARSAWRLRIDADYGPDPVRREILEPLLARVRRILEGLGVRSPS